MIFEFSHVVPSVLMLDELDGNSFVCSLSLSDFIRLRHPTKEEIASMDAIERRIREHYSTELAKQEALDMRLKCAG